MKNPFRRKPLPQLRLMIVYSELQEEPVVRVVEGFHPVGTVENVVGIRWRWDGSGVAQGIVEIADMDMLTTDMQVSKQVLSDEDLAKRTEMALKPREGEAA